MIPRTTLEQWAVLRAVVEQGGFSQAAEALNKSQSSVSYAIKTLQQQLPVPVLTLKGRKAELTPAGEVLLRRSGQLLEEALVLEKIADNLAQGWEPEITLVVDMVFPQPVLYEALARFDPVSCGTRIRIIDTSLSATDEALFSGEADIVLCSRVPTGFTGEALFDVEFVAVAHKDHALHQLERTLNAKDLQGERQIVVRDTGIKRNQDAGWLSSELRWTVSSFNASVALLQQGLGFAWVPDSYVEPHLASGELRPLPLHVGQRRHLKSMMILPDCDNSGPATKKFAEVLMQLARERQVRQSGAAGD